MKVLWPAGFDLFQLTFVFQFPVPARRKIPHNGLGLGLGYHYQTQRASIQVMYCPSPTLPYNFFHEILNILY
jgi:hypothetical protein